jgi:hypothetical protein
MKYGDTNSWPRDKMIRLKYPPGNPTGVRRSTFTVHRSTSPFTVQPFTVHRSPFGVQRSNGANEGMSGGGSLAPLFDCAQAFLQSSNQVDDIALWGLRSCGGPLLTFGFGLD